VKLRWQHITGHEIEPFLSHLENTVSHSHVRRLTHLFNSSLCKPSRVLNKTKCQTINSGNSIYLPHILTRCSARSNTAFKNDTFITRHSGILIPSWLRIFCFLDLMHNASSYEGEIGRVFTRAVLQQM
jgi:hypothetical protein